MDWYDSNGDGYTDFGVADTNGDGYYDLIQADTNFDGYVDLYITDSDGNGYFDTYFSDTNEDGITDSQGWDVNADGVLDYYADASTAWNAVAIDYSAGVVTGPGVVGPAMYDSPQMQLASMPINDVFTAVTVGNLIYDMNHMSDIWLLPSPW